MGKRMNVTVWNEKEGPYGPYPEGIHNAIAGFLRESNRFGTVRTAVLPQPEHGLSHEVLNDTDVLVWWGHNYHHMVSDEIVSRVQERVLNGMGLLVLHSAHASKIFGRLMGTRTHRLRWRDGDLERIWRIEAGHPIAKGVPEYIELPQSEMYGEYFDIPRPDELIFISWYSGGEVFRSGCTFTRGNGRIFFFSPGHEAFPIYYRNDIQQIIMNGIEWACPNEYPVINYDHMPESPEALRMKQV